MIATCVIECLLALFVAFRYPSALFRSILCLLLVCLASFQFAEYQVCLGPASAAAIWSKIGVAGITLLPALGMHLISEVTRKSALVTVGYAIATAYAIAFLFVPGMTAPAECYGNYVIIHIQPGLVGVVYELYYSFFVLLAMAELGARLLDRNPPASYGYSRKLITFTLLSFLSFTTPMAVAAILSNELRHATPSIMCGFAVFLALILTLFVAPLYAEESQALIRSA